MLCRVLCWALGALVFAAGGGPGPRRETLTPGRGAVTPDREVLTPGDGAVTPEGEVLTPGDGAVTPEEKTMTPGREALTPEQQTVTPEEQTMTPGIGAVTPGNGGVTLDGLALTPGDGAMSLGNGAVTPGGGAVTPGGGAVTSGGGAVTPEEQAMTSRRGALTPEQETMTPGTGAITPGNGAVTPGGGAVTPGGGAVTPAGGAVTPAGGAVSQTPANVTAKSLGSAVPICTCDLAGGVCELDCCCDPDCSSADINVFSSCLPGSEPVISQFCIEKSVIFTSNSPFPTVIHKDHLDSLFCVIVNDPKTNYFVPPRPVTRESFPSLVSQFGRGSFIPSQRVFVEGGGRITAAPKHVYQFGDQIFTLFPEAVVLGVFMQPTALVGEECTDRNPAGFLQSQSSTCSRRVGDLNATCGTLPTLNAATYYENFVLLQSPNFTTVNEILNFTNVNKVEIVPEGGVLSSPSAMNGMCKNVVSEVTYRIQYKGGKGIVGASVTFAFTNVSLSATKIPQIFHVFFVTNPASNAAERRSGNPGYLTGKPILAFNGQAVASLTVLKSVGDGSCFRSGRSSVLFGHNMRAGCSFRFAPGQTCSELQTHINLLLLGDRPPDSLGILGNASGSEIEGLTRIVNPVPEALSMLCETSCILTLALEIQILWANTGPLANPQAAVLGARFQYQRQNVQCSTGAVSLRTSVTFIETTIYPPPPRDQTTTDCKLPFDFFYPFKVSTSGVGKPVGSILGSVIVMGLLSQR